MPGARNDARKRRDWLGLATPSSARQRSRRRTGSNVSAVLLAAAAAVVVAVAIASGIAHAAHAPEMRAPIHEPRRLVWEEHVEDLERRNCFMRFYRMPLETFLKLAGLLRPHLERNAGMAELRTSSGVIPVNIRLAVALRILAGGSYLDVMVLFGLGQTTVFTILWEVIDAINKTPAVGGFFFPQTEAECKLAAGRWEKLSTNGVFTGVVAAVDGLFIRCKAPTAKETANVTAYYSGSKSGYGINVQATCDSNMRFCNVSTISPGATNDWVAWNRSCLSRAAQQLPEDYYIIGDAAYPISNQLLTPYPGRGLQPGPDSFNFHLSQLRVKIEQSFGLLVATWGILWRRLGVQFAGRPDLITALFHLHNFLRDEKIDGVKLAEEDAETGRGRPVQGHDGRLTDERWRSPTPAPSRSGSCGARLAIMLELVGNTQWRPDHNNKRNS